MGSSATKSNAVGNRILAALPRAAYQKLEKKLELYELKIGGVIYEPQARMGNVFFPNSGIVSFLSEIERRSTLEVGVVGNEGLVGLSIFLGIKRSPNTAVVRAAGVASRMKASDFQKECAENAMLARLVNRYAHLLLTQLSLVGACNRFHPVIKRLAFWLLMTSDRMQVVRFEATQQFISNMLGVRREAVVLAARGLHEKQLISYSRGVLSILNRPGLEAFSCRCYAVLKEEELNYIS